MKPVTRRSGMAGSAAVVAIPVLPAAASPGAGELTAKIRKLKDNWEGIGEMDDPEADKLYENVIQPHYKTFVGVPARSAEDALAAFDYLISRKT